MVACSLDKSSVTFFKRRQKGTEKPHYCYLFSLLSPHTSEPPPLTLPLQLISSAQTTFLTCSEAAIHKAFGQQSSSNCSPESSSCPQQNLVSSTVASHIPEGKSSGQNSQWHRRYLVCTSIFRVFLLDFPLPNPK